jgi:hypothetical protein
MDLPMDKISVVKPFVKHFMGCQFCSGINAEKAESCEDDFNKSWVYANAQVEEKLSIS